MVSTGVVIAISAVLIGVVNAVFTLRVMKRIERVTTDVGSHFSEIDMDNKISSMFSSESAQTIDGLSKMVFQQLQNKYGLEARSYNELTEEIKLSPSIPLELKELLIDFFTQIIRISYQENPDDNEQKEQLKQKIKIIFKQLK